MTAMHSLHKESISFHFIWVGIWSIFCPSFRTFASKWPFMSLTVCGSPTAGYIGTMHDDDFCWLSIILPSEIVHLLGQNAMNEHDRAPYLYNSHLASADLTTRTLHCFLSRLIPRQKFSPFLISYFDLVGYTLTKYEDIDCLYGDNLHQMVRFTDDENCKQWCFARDDCAGFTARFDKCFFKRVACKDNVFNQTESKIYLKQTVYIEHGNL